MAATLFALPAFAHPGHSLKDATAAHLVTSPYHLAILLLIGVGFFVGARFVHARLPRQVMNLTGIAFLLGAVVLWGLRA